MEALAFEVRIIGSGIPFREGCILIKFAREQTPGQRAVDQDSYVVFQAVWDDLFQSLPVKKVEFGLIGVQRGNLSPGLHLLHAVVAHTDRSNLPFIVELFHGGRRLFYRRIRIRPVYLVDVDIIRVQIAQAVLHFLANTLRL